MDAYDDQSMVLDNDGVPIEIGDAVYGVFSGNGYKVEGFGEDGKPRITAEPGIAYAIEPDRITHEPPSGWNLPACCSEQDTRAPWNQPDAYTCCDCDQYDGATRDCGFCAFRYARLVEEAGGKAPAPRDVSGCVVPWDQCVCGGFSEVQ